jgi:phosphatidylglycerol---prolipoprotein diacylglyceryl transferase
MSEHFFGMLAYYVHDLSPFLVRFGENFGLRWYGLAYVAAFLLGIVVVRSLSRRGWCDIPPENVSDFIIGTAIFGVLLGGRLGYMLFYRPGELLHDPIVIFKVWDGGMSAHGGILGVTFYTLWYAWRHKLSWRNIGDNLVVAVPIGLFLGRIANFINGELYGRITSVAWAIQFPKELFDAPPETLRRAVLAAEQLNPAWTTPQALVDNVGTSPELRIQLGEILSPRHPSQVYEAVLEGAILFLILWILRTRFRLRNGVLTGIFFVGYALLRSVAEVFREPDAALTGPFTRGQFLSLFLILIGLAFLISAKLQPAWPRHRGSKS